MSIKEIESWYFGTMATVKSKRSLWIKSATTEDVLDQPIAANIAFDAGLALSGHH
jgi:hypothetical protein